MSLFTRLTVISGLSVLLCPIVQAGVLDSHLAETIQQTPSDQLVSVWIEVKSDHSARDFQKSVAASSGAPGTRIGCLPE